MGDGARDVLGILIVAQEAVSETGRLDIGLALGMYPGESEETFRRGVGEARIGDEMDAGGLGRIDGRLVLADAFVHRRIT